MSTQKISTEEILANLKIQSLNEMQLAAIAASKEHDDIILLSATGSGKTLAYLLPLLDRIDRNNKNTQAIIIVPTRELAQQVEEVFKAMSTKLKITACYGGHLRETEENNLKQAPALIVGTPGRLGDHIRRGSITVPAITMLVLDEYDKSLEFGFEEEMDFIIQSLPNVSKRMLTSATPAAAGSLPVYLKDPITLNFLPEGALPQEKLTLKILKSDDKDKTATLFNLLCYTGGKTTIVFCNHRDAVERTSNYLTTKGLVNTYYHGGMEQQQRDTALSKFRNGSVNILVTTDLAARGLDIPGIKYIVHYHLPLSEDSFTHRNGRTARMEASGNAVMILAEDEFVPPYIDAAVEELILPEELSIPEPPKWTTLFIAAGKKDKVNKIDIVGFLGQKGELKKDDIGLIDVKDYFSFVAIRKSKVSMVLQLIKNEKIKNKKVMIAVAK